MQMKQGLQELLVLKDQQEKTLKKRERELAALKGVLKEEMAIQEQEMGHLKEQHVRELQSLSDSLAKATEVSEAPSRIRGFSEQKCSSALVPSCPPPTPALAVCLNLLPQPAREMPGTAQGSGFPSPARTDCFVLCLLLPQSQSWHREGSALRLGIGNKSRALNHSLCYSPIHFLLVWKADIPPFSKQTLRQSVNCF